MIEQTEPLIYQSLNEFINSHLGRGDFLEIDGSYTYKRLFDYRPISDTLANQILAITGNMHTAYIQHADKYSPHLKGAVLWDYSAWVMQCDKFNRAAERSRIERIANYIKEENRRRFAKAIVKIASIDYDLAFDSAGKLMCNEGWETKAAKLEGFELATQLDNVKE